MLEQNSTAALDTNHEELRLWRRPTFVSLAITLVILVSLGAMLDVQETWRRIMACDKALMVLGSAAHYATYFVRGYRWQRCLAHVLSPCRWRMFTLLVFFANSIDNVVPGKLADVYAAHLAWINCGVRRATAMGAIIFLRLVDAWGVLLLAALASWWLFATRLPRAVLWSLLLGVGIAGGMTLILLASLLCIMMRLRWIPSRVQQIIRVFHTGMWPPSGELGLIAVLTGLVWGLEILWTVSLAAAFDVKVRPVQGVFLTMIPVLASAFPLTPSGVGVVEVTMYTCLRMLDVPAVTAASMTVVHRLVDHWLHIGVGALLWVFRRSIGLRTWLEASPPEASGAQSLKRSLREGRSYGA